MGRKRTKYTFGLVGLNTSHINEKYGFNAPRAVKETVLPQNATRLCDLEVIDKGTPEVISFLDDTKKPHTCYISMIDHTTQMQIGMLRYECYWCRYPFDTQGIGCPIRHVPNQAVKTYFSEISKDIYTIKENVSTSRNDVIADSRIEVQKADFYETDGVFCSFNCVQAWIDAHKHDRMYDRSQNLLQKMYGDITGDYKAVIIPAPHWRERRESGGHLTMTTFREGFNKIDYRDHGNCFNFRPIGRLYEETIRF